MGYDKLKKEAMFAEQLAKIKPRCPKCQRYMIQKFGPHEDFWGCSYFPKCKGTRKITARYKKIEEELRKAWLI